MGNTELNLFRLKQNLNSFTKKKKLGKRFPSFLCLGIPGCSKLHHHWPCSTPALSRSAKRQRGGLCCLLLSFLPRFFTLPARISPLPAITAQTGTPSSHHLLQLNLNPNPPERDHRSYTPVIPTGPFQLRMFHDFVILSHHGVGQRAR